MLNIKKSIDSHNKILPNDKNTTNDAICYCRQKDNCPLNGDCRKRGIVYQATVTRQDVENRKHTLDYARLTLKQDTVTTKPHSTAQLNATRLNLENTFGNSKTAKPTTTLHGKY